MRKHIGLLLLVVLLFIAINAYAIENVPIHYPQILDAWNASNSDELYHHILEYWQASATEYPQAFTAKHQPLSIKIGGNTKELIAEKSKWDLAIVSSKDVDLQALANEKLIMSTGNNPSNVFALHQWLLPEKMIHLLPKDSLMLYYIYIYDYDIQLDEATFIICQDNIGRKRNHPRGPDEFAAEIMQRRSVHAVRTLEGIRQVDAWTEKKLLEADNVYMTEHMRPVDAWTDLDLINKVDDWDIAIVLMDADDKLEALDHAGLLYDFSQNSFFLERTSIRPYERYCGNTYPSLPIGILSADGRMIAIPCREHTKEDSGTEGVLIVNAKSVHLDRALSFAVHLLKSKDWSWTAENKMWPHGCDTCIYKDEVDW